MSQQSISTRSGSPSTVSVQSSRRNSTRQRDVDPKDAEGGDHSSGSKSSGKPPNPKRGRYECEDSIDIDLFNATMLSQKNNSEETSEMLRLQKQSLAQTIHQQKIACEKEKIECERARLELGIARKLAEIEIDKAKRLAELEIKAKENQIAKENK